MSGFRRYGRKPLKCEVKLSHNEVGDILAETTDVSETGLFIRCAEWMNGIAIGDTFTAELSSNDGCSSNAQVTVVRHTKEGLGLAFE